MSSVRSGLRLRAVLTARASVATRQQFVRSFSASHFDEKSQLADESVLEHLVCPISKFPLRYDAKRGSLLCDEINVEYPIYQGVPLLVPSEGRVIHSSKGNDQ